MTDEEIRQKVIGCAYKIHNTLGAGFVEKVYENAMRIELLQSDLRVRQQAPIQVIYAGEIVGEFVADLLVEEDLIVELKAATSLQKEHEIQLVNYLTATGFEIGLLINFGRSVEVRRKHREYRKSESCSS